MTERERHSITNKENIAKELYSFFEKNSLCEKRNKKYPLPISIRVRTISRELFRQIYPEQAKELKSFYASLHIEKITSITISTDTFPGYWNGYGAGFCLSKYGIVPQ